MLRWSVLIVLFVCASSPLAARETPFHIRGLDAWANESLERGLDTSTVIRTLAAQLAETDVIVHVETSTGLPHGLAGTTRFASDVGEFRYVRITLGRDLDPFQRAAALAHELQHALELAASDARSPEEMLALYKRIGYRTGGQWPRYETAAAVEIGVRAFDELRRRHTRTRTQ